MERTTAAAQEAYDRGVMIEAATLYEQALTRARLMDDPREIGDAAFDLAACLAAMDQLDRARVLLHEAAWDLNRIGAADDDVILLEARIAWMQKNASDLMALTDKLISPAAAKRSPIVAGKAHLLRANQDCLEHQIPPAQSELNAAQKIAKSDADMGLAAGIADTSGRIAMEQNRPADAAASFDSAAVLYQKAGAYSEMEWSLDRAGGAYVAAGNPANAADRFYRSARSMAAEGRAEWEKARTILARAADAAAAAHLSGLLEQIHSLSKEIEPATQPSSPP